MKKQLREKVWLKYGRHCAYCGTVLEYKDMQVDHIWPKRYNGTDDFENLNPSCRSCNHYKRASDLHSFRLTMLTLHKRVMAQYITKVAVSFGIVTITKFDGKFYFEKCK